MPILYESTYMKWQDRKSQTDKRQISGGKELEEGRSGK